MQKIYKIVIMLLTFFVTFTQTKAQVANCCAECQADVRAISDKQVLLEKIEIPKGSVANNVSANVYVSYQSGNTQKFWTNLVIATAGIAVSTQLGGNSTPVTAGDSRTQSSGISPAIPLGVSAVLIPSIWKNRPRGVPEAGLYVQHRDLKGKLTQSWEQPISSEAKNSAELLTVAIDKPLSEGSLEIYLQNRSKNEVFYWGLSTIAKVTPLLKEVTLTKPEEQLISTLSIIGCPDGFISNGEGKCFNATSNKYVQEGTEDNPITIRREVGERLSDFNPKPNIIGKTLLPPKPNPDSNPLVCVSTWLCYPDMCYLMNETCYGETIDGGGTPGGGGGENNEALEIRKRECLLANTQFNNDVSWAQFIREESKVGCVNALGWSNWDTFTFLAALAEGATAVGLLLQAGGVFVSLDDMWSCMTAADQKYGWDIESAYNRHQSTKDRFDCAHLY